MASGLPCGPGILEDVKAACEGLPVMRVSFFSKTPKRIVPDLISWITAPPATTSMWVACRNLGGSQSHQMAPLVRIPPDLRTVLAAHVAL
jgi:hypothetical protein